MEKGQLVFGGSTSQPETNSVSRTVSADERVSASLENWKRKLLDLSKRNRALNFKMNKVSTIAIVDEQPAEVFRQLYLDERAMRFKAAPEAEEQLSLIEGNAAINTGERAAPRDQSQTNHTASADTVIELSPPNAEEDEDESLSLDFAPYDPGSLDETTHG
jgi:hypothetical protein